MGQIEQIWVDFGLFGRGLACLRTLLLAAGSDALGAGSFYQQLEDEETEAEHELRSHLELLSTPKLLPLEAVYDGGLTSSFAALAPKPLEARIKRKSAPNGLVAAVQEAPVSYSENYSAQPVAETTSQAARHRHAKLDALVAKLEHERQLVKEDLMRYR